MVPRRNRFVFTPRTHFGIPPSWYAPTDPRPCLTSRRLIAALLGAYVAEPARRLEQPVVLSPAARATLQMNRRAGVNPGRVLSCQLQLDVGVEDPDAGGAARISIGGAEKLIQLTQIGHLAPSSLNDGYPRCGIFVRSLRLATNGALQIRSQAPSAEPHIASSWPS